MTQAAEGANIWPDPVLSMPVAGLDALLPLHLQLSKQGRISAAGPLLRRIFAPHALLGESLFALFDVQSEAGTEEFCDDICGLRCQLGRPLQLWHAPLQLRLRGLGMALAQPQGGVLLNLSLGTALATAVQRFGLKQADFAATDMAAEVLFLAEANTAVLAEMRGFYQRSHAARRRAEREAMTDPLTGLRNRRASDAFLARLAAPSGQVYSLLQIDLDHFKAINDLYGHAMGDQVLCHVAEVLRQSTRAGDCAARLGGDEFLLILPGLQAGRRLQTLAQTILRRIGRMQQALDETMTISASIGIASHKPCEGTSERLARVDRALYAAKALGRGRAFGM